MSIDVPTLPTPHFDKLNALSRNQRLPEADRIRVEEAVQRYHDWIRELEDIQGTKKETVQQLVDATNRYKEFVELDLIFDSLEDFLYRQKGQLKLDNSILEEFLPHLIHKGLDFRNSSIELGPQKTFAGLSFMSSLSNLGTGGHPTLRT